MTSYNVKITSKEMVRPSSPTPHHLRLHKLSLLDQMAPQAYIPLIFFYKSYHIEQQRHLLKKSLSNILTEFYPLAGRLSRQNFTIDCNDMGALFVESKVEGSLLEAINDPAMHELEKLLPIRSAAAASGEENAIVLAIQINHFDCGGIAVSVQMHHKVGDANSMVSFMNAWAAAASKHQQTSIPPTFDMASLFPPKDMLSTIDSEPPNPSTENLVSKRLVFNKEALENLKLQASQVVKDPTRVEAVSSFLAKDYFRDACKAKGSSKKYVALIHVVNLRPRMDPPLPSHAFGNAISGAVALLPIDDDDDDGNKEDLVEALRNAIRKTDGDFVKEKLQGDEYSDSLRKFGALCLKAEPCFFSSWTRFPVYEVDYGWGRPVWVVTASFSDMRNTVILMSTSCGVGMEAWLNMNT